MSKAKTVYNIVDSIKGGCGKTTFSVLLSLVMDERAKKAAVGAGTENIKGACLIDMDIQGTALKYLLYGEKEKEDEQTIYLNERVSSFEEDEKNYIKEFRLKNSAYGFDVIMCNPKQKEKDKYRSLATQNYSPEIMCSTFRVGFLDMIKNVQKSKSFCYENIVFDMPPNSDGYSDAVYDCILDGEREKTVLHEGDLCNVFIVQTMDKSQRSASIDYALSLIREKNHINLNKIFFVFNDFLSFQMEDVDEGDFFDDAVVQVQEAIKVESLSSEYADKIYFVGLKFVPQYYRRCTTEDGIGNLPAEEIRNVIGFVQFLRSFKGKRTVSPKTEELLKLIMNE